jgi:hypothetical protein
MFVGSVTPCGSYFWCALHRTLVRLSLALVGLVFVPAFGGGYARAGYLPSELLYSSQSSPEMESLRWFGSGCDQPELVVAGISRSLEEEREECLDDSGCYLLRAIGAGAKVRLGSGRTLPATPVTRKGIETHDVVFYPDPSAPRNPAARQSVFGYRVMVHHPCCDRLFRPPRPA